MNICQSLLNCKILPYSLRLWGVKDWSSNLKCFVSEYCNRTAKMKRTGNLSTHFIWPQISRSVRSMKLTRYGQLLWIVIKFTNSIWQPIVIHCAIEDTSGCKQRGLTWQIGNFLVSIHLSQNPMSNRCPKSFRILSWNQKPWLGFSR